MIEEESALLRQKKMEFEFEKATFSKQTEFAKNVLKKQDDEIKVLNTKFRFIKIRHLVPQLEIIK